MANEDQITVDVRRRAATHVRRFLIGLVIVTTILFLSWAGLRQLFLWPTPDEAYFVAIAERNQHVVAAIFDFRNERGVLPQTLRDLYPAYLERYPDASKLHYDGDSLSIHAGLPHTYVIYQFASGREGWLSGGDFGMGSLPVPKPATTRPTVSGDALVVARLAEYDRRIATDRDPSRYYVYRNYTQKIAFLLSIGRKEEALNTCALAARKFPDWWRPRIAMLMLAPPEDAPRVESEAKAWAEAYPTFSHHWYLCVYYRKRGRHDEAVAALREAVKHSLGTTAIDEGWVPDAFAFDAAAYACSRSEPELVLEITRLWERPRGLYDYHNDNLHAFRAAAELALGRFDEARADLDRVVTAGKTQGLWVGNLDRLANAITARDRTFVYNAGNLPSEWSLLPPSE